MKSSCASRLCSAPPVPQYKPRPNLHHTHIETSGGLSCGVSVFVRLVVCVSYLTMACVSPCRALILSHPTSPLSPPPLPSTLAKTPLHTHRGTGTGTQSSLGKKRRGCLLPSTQTRGGGVVRYLSPVWAGAGGERSEACKGRTTTPEAVDPCAAPASVCVVGSVGGAVGSTSPYRADAHRATGTSTAKTPSHDPSPSTDGRGGRGEGGDSKATHTHTHKTIDVRTTGTAQTRALVQCKRTRHGHRGGLTCEECLLLCWGVGVLC